MFLEPLPARPCLVCEKPVKYPRSYVGKRPLCKKHDHMGPMLSLAIIRLKEEHALPRKRESEE